MPPESCPNCGADVPPRARACPECGSDESTGWSEKSYADNLGLPDEEFDYEKFVKEEFAPPGVKPRGVHWVWWLTALGLVVLFAIFYFR
jgi:hypothetical protein